MKQNCLKQRPVLTHPVKPVTINRHVNSTNEVFCSSQENYCHGHKKKTKETKHNILCEACVEKCRPPTEMVRKQMDGQWWKTYMENLLRQHLTLITFYKLWGGKKRRKKGNLINYNHKQRRGRGSVCPLWYHLKVLQGPVVCICNPADNWV